MMSFYQTIIALRQVLSEQRQKVEILAQVCGGWEGWLQCEIAHVLSPNVVREQQVYGDARKCDLQFESGFVVELKCYGRAQTTKSKQFGQQSEAIQSSVDTYVAKVAQDVGKIQQLLGTGQHGCAIAVVPDFSLNETESIRGGLFGHFNQQEKYLGAFWILAYTGDL
jgi:hypothetical protein